MPLWRVLHKIFRETLGVLWSSVLFSARIILSSLGSFRRQNVLVMRSVQVLQAVSLQVDTSIDIVGRLNSCEKYDSRVIECECAVECVMTKLRKEACFSRLKCF